MPIPAIRKVLAPRTIPFCPEEDGTGADPYRELLFAVIGRAIKDYEYVKCSRNKPSLTPYERKMLRELTSECHPADFFGSQWFEYICAMLEVQPETIRKRL